MSRADRWVLGEPADLPRLLVCLPHAGAGATSYVPWTAPLAGGGVAVCPVQLPGRENRFREPPQDSLEPLLEGLLSALLRHLDRPFALFGHSFGALLAYELCRLLDELGLRPLRLLVSGRIAPQLRDPRAQMHHLPDAELIGQLRRLGGIPQALLASPELVALQLPALRADLTINETYQHVPGPALDVPVSAFGGDHDPKVDESELRAWGRVTRADFRARLLPGGHFFVGTARDELLRHVLGDLADGGAPSARQRQLPSAGTAVPAGVPAGRAW